MVAGEMRPPVPWFTYHVVPFVCVVFIVALRPNLATRLAVLYGLASVHLHSLHFDTGETFRNYSTGTGLGMLWFSALHLMLLSNPMEECRHETHKSSLTEQPLWKRSYYVSCLIFNVRGIGWSYQIKQHPPLPCHTRLQFIISRILRIAWYALIVDAAQVFISLNPIFWLPEDHTRSLRSQGLVLNIVNILAYTSRTYSSLNMGYDLIALVSVATGLSEPRYWPVLFGRWRDAYTIRRFWGRVWQQWLRRFVASIGKFAARTLGCVRGSWLSSRVQLLVGFIVSGLAHVPGDAMVHPKYTGCSFWFFPAQAVVITAEDFVIDLGKRLGVREAPWTRLVGYTWTFVWFAYTTPWFVDWAVRSGQAQDMMVPFSVVSPSLDYLAATTGFDVKSWIAAQCEL